MDSRASDPQALAASYLRPSISISGVLPTRKSIFRLQWFSCVSQSARVSTLSSGTSRAAGTMTQDRDAEAEDAPLLGQKQSATTARRYLTKNIRVDYAYLPLLVCCFLTGLIDAASYNAWTVFMGMQTGMALCQPRIQLTFMARKHHLPGLEHRWTSCKQ